MFMPVAVFLLSNHHSIILTFQLFNSFIDPELSAGSSIGAQENVDPL